MCQERDALLKKLSDAGNSLLVHLREQTAAITSGDPDFGRFDYIIEEAKIHKCQIGHDYDEHVVHHACGCPLYRTSESLRMAAAHGQESQGMQS
jgi:hypothetical protein